MMVCNRPLAKTIAGLTVLLIAGAYLGCSDGSGSEEAPRGSAPKDASEAAHRGGMILAMSDFEGSGITAKLGFLRPDGSSDTGWGFEVVADPQNQVFHKAAWFQPVDGDPGVLSIAASAGKGNARMKLWRKKGDTWTGETIFEGTLGAQKHDRLRDFEVGDVNGDGVDDIVVVTHDVGVVLVFEQKEGEFTPTEIDRAADPEEHLWIHEVEIGDVDGDGKNEFFATPSAPNTFTKGKEQPGFIVMYRWNGEKYDKTIIEELHGRHAKEILIADPKGSGRPALFTALEGDNQGGLSSAIKAYWFEEGSLEPKGEEIGTLPGTLCRFLNCGDTDGDGIKELIASTKSDGIHSFAFKDGKWVSKEIVSGRVSASFEHATVLSDHDHDGVMDLFVGSDDQFKVRRYFYDSESGRYLSEDILHRKDREDEYNSSSKKKGKYFCWNIMPLPDGK
jgi:hypothetical protein